MPNYGQNGKTQKSYQGTLDLFGISLKIQLIQHVPNPFQKYVFKGTAYQLKQDTELEKTNFFGTPCISL